MPDAKLDESARFANLLESHDSDQEEVSLRASINQLCLEQDEKKIAKVKERKRVLEEFTFLKDLADIPVMDELLDWSLFNVDFLSTDREYSQVADIIDMYPDKLIDIRPYVIERPFLV